MASNAEDASPHKNSSPIRSSVIANRKSLNCPSIQTDTPNYVFINSKRTMPNNSSLYLEAAYKSNERSRCSLSLLDQFSDQKKKESLKKTILEMIKIGSKIFPAGMLYRDIMDLLKTSYKVPDSFQFKLIMENCLAQLVGEGILDKKCTLFKLKENSTDVKEANGVFKLSCHQKNYLSLHKPIPIYNRKEKFFPEIRTNSPTDIPASGSIGHKNRDEDIRKMCLNRANRPQTTTLLPRENGITRPIVPDLNQDRESTSNISSESDPMSQFQFESATSEYITQLNQEIAALDALVGPILQRNFYTLRPTSPPAELPASVPSENNGIVDGEEEDQNILNDIYGEFE